MVDRGATKKWNLSTICRALARVGYTRKQLKRWSARRCEALRSVFIDNMRALYFADQLLFIDETRRDGKSLRRRFGRAPRGCTPVVLTLPGRSKAHSILAMCSMDGVIEQVTVEGGFDGELFMDAFETHFLEHVRAFPAPGSVVVMDNCAIHKKEYERLKATIEERGGLLIFLPPYSPDFNPIESIFANFKRWLKRNAKDWGGPGFDIDAFVARGFRECVTAEGVRNLYRHSEYEFAR